MRLDALTITSALQQNAGITIPAGVGMAVAILAVMFGLLASWRQASVATFALASATALVMALPVQKQAFCNYYYSN